MLRPRLEQLRRLLNEGLAPARARLPIQAGASRAAPAAETHKTRFILLFTAAHGALSALLISAALRLAVERAATGRSPTRWELLLGTSAGFVSAPVSTLLALLPSAAGLSAGLWRALPVLTNSFLWACALWLLLGGRGRRARGLGL